MIRILVVDDHSFVRSSVCCVLREAAGIEVVGDCAGASELLDLVGVVRPHVVLMDIRMPVRSGLDATRDLLVCQPTLRVLMFTGALTGRLVDEAARAGAVGLLLKGGDSTILVQAVRRVAAGGTAWPAGSRSAVVGH